MTDYTHPDGTGGDGADARLDSRERGGANEGRDSHEPDGTGAGRGTREDGAARSRADELSDGEADPVARFLARLKSRRDFLAESAGAGVGLIAARLIVGGAALADTGEELAPAAAALDPQSGGIAVRLSVNGKAYPLDIDPRVTLLDALRERIGLTGTKKGCDRGQCGACTVLADGHRINSCLALAAAYEGAEITTVEGLAKGDELHPLQAAFIKHDGFQCGYCTPGQLMSAAGLLAEGRPPGMTVRECMSGNICRCGAYPGIVAAIEEVRASGAKS